MHRLLLTRCAWVPPAGAGGNTLNSSGAEADLFPVIPSTSMRLWAGGIVAAVALLASPAAATTVVYSQATSGNIYSYDTVSGTTTLLMDQTVVFDDGSANVDALWVDSTMTTFVFSVANTELIGGVSYGDEDLITYDTTTGTASLYLDLTSVLGASKDVNAVYVLANGDVLLSTTTGASIGALSFGSQDIVEYNPSTGTASLYFDGTAVLGKNANVDAVQVGPSGQIVFSTASNLKLGGTTYNKNDLLAYDPISGTVSLYLDTSTLLGGVGNVNGIYVPEPDTALLMVSGTLGLLFLGRRRT